MKKIYMLLFIGALFMMKAQGQIITQSLQTELDNADPSDLLAITITMNDQYDIATISHLLENMTRQDRRLLVVSELKSFADISQQSLMNTITGFEALGQVENVRQLWCVNMIACKAKPAAINQLAQRQDIRLIHIDEIFEIDQNGIEPNNCWGEYEDPPETPYHIDSLYVPAVWAMGFEGEDVVVAVLDTGVDHEHPDLEGNMWVNPVGSTHGFNYVDDNDDTMDQDGHGTHVAGIIAGNGSGNNNIKSKTGIAPKAKIMAVRVFDWEKSLYHTTIMEGVQFSIDNGADILNISWGAQIVPTDTSVMRIWRQCMNHLLAAGSIVTVSAGNNENASIPNQIRIPGNVPPPWKHHQQANTSEGGQSAVICVGSVDENGSLAPDSAKGPVTWEDISPFYDYPEVPGGLIRPDVVAPGVDIISLMTPWNWEQDILYTCKSGTSMAAPAVAGVMALMLSKNPYLLPAELDSIIEMTAFHPENTPGWPLFRKKDNYIGSGRVRADLAVAAVPDSCTLEIDTIRVLNYTVMPCNIIVKPGGTLTINKDLWFRQGKKIIVEPGGKLFVTGAKISGYNNAVWQGIEVWGNSTENQLPDTQGNYSQGYVNLNNATIENALTAVNLWKPDDLSKTGGIVIANNTVFRNNSRAVHALNYTNYIHNQEMEEVEIDYVATFTRCSFEIDVNYPGAETFEKHVELREVRGVKFLACDFSLISSNAINVSDVNVGIEANSAGFSVNAICTSSTIPCSSYDSCTFTGFHKAIYAKVARSTTRTFYVNRAQFHGNAYGIHVHGINNFIVLNSDFHIGFNAPEMDPCDSEGRSASGFGIFTSNCTGFAIEENYFTKKAGSASWPVYTGIHIAETQAADQVYRNTFNNLNHGNYAVGKNWFLNYTWQGLAYYCNFNTANVEDIKVIKDTTVYPPIGGIQHLIGSPALPAGNTFSTSANIHININNDGNHWINYYYDTDNCPSEVYQVNLFEVVDVQNPCPSNYSGGGSERDVVMTPAQKQQAEMAFATGFSLYNDVYSLYNYLKDGGNTPATLSEIETAWPSDMWELRAELLDKSPHLSMEVLKAAADRTDVLPESVIFEIMAANPDELKKDELIKYLQYKDNPLPEYMIDILKQVAMGSTYKTVLQRQMAHYGQLKTRAAHNIIRSLLNDTIADNNELRNWLENIGGKRADEQIIASYLSEGNTTDALARANMMPTLYNYTGNELAEHNYYMDMLNLQISLEQQQRTISDLDSLEVANLLYIAENSNGTAGIQAKGILEYAYGYHFCNCIESDESGLKSGKPFNPASLKKLSGIEITVVPNPARDWAAFNYTLPANATRGVIVINDVSGKEIASMPVSGKQGQRIWDTRTVKPGVYFFTLNAAGFSKHGKMVISK